VKREIITTADGSKTVRLTEWNEQYHSVHGAIAEALHVYLDAGLNYFLSQFPEQKQINILEIGLGTGLNAYITALEAKKLYSSINYVGIEAFPVVEEEYTQLNYHEFLGDDRELFLKIHDISWSEKVLISKNFSLTKLQSQFSEIDFKEEFHLIYYDAFGPRVQPELWTEEIFRKMFYALKENGVLVTYSCKGDVRRAMKAAGFEVQKIPGPAGKREMVRALKLS